MPSSRFGAGQLFGVPLGTASPTPVMFSALQDVSVDFSQDLKQLYGSGKYALEQAGGKAKIEVKATIGRFDPFLFNAIYFGGTMFAGVEVGSTGEAATTGTTVAVANAANYRVNLGVYVPATGKFLAQVSSAPSSGQYSVNVATGTYTFGDTGLQVLIYYSYGAATGGFSIVSGNPTLGVTPYFSMKLVQPFNGKQTVLTLNKCMSSKLSMPLKLDDFTMPALTFSAQDDGTGNVFTYSMQD